MTETPTKQEPNLSTNKKKIPSKVCRYFKKGFCGFGEKCSYKHNEPKSRSSDSENCRFYKKASCKFASKCWYKHIRPNGKEYRKPGPFNKFIVVGPSGEEPDTVVREVEIRRSFRRPRNQESVSKNCFYFKEKGKCYYEDKCWYSHSEPYAHPGAELLCTESPKPEQELEKNPDLPDLNKMCYNFIFSECEFGNECVYVHGDICQFCDLPFLHPFDEQQRNQHLQACEMFFLEDMDNSFKFMVSKDKMCAICLEYVWGPDKLFTEQKFGIQEKCNHIFCLKCIRKWRQVKWKLKEPLGCPACRKESRFVVPCSRWFESEEEKQQWIKNYEAVITNKPCKFYAKGKCMYEHKCLFVHSGFTLPLRVEEISGTDGDIWEDFRSDNQLPSAQVSHGTLSADQQDAGGQDFHDFVQEQQFWDDTPLEYLTIQGLNSQLGEQVIPSNLADEHQLHDNSGLLNVVDDDGEQDVEMQVRQDPNRFSDDTRENQITLPLQSSEHISPSNLSETTTQQFDDNLQ